MNTLFKEVFTHADKIITYKATAEKFISYGVNKKKIFIQHFSGVNLKEFNPKVSPLDFSKHGIEDENVPIIGYINKIERFKGVFNLIDAASKVKKDFRLLFVTPKQNRDSLISKLKQCKLLNKSIIINSVPPWVVTSVMKSCTAVVSAEHDFPIVEHNPRIPREVMATGVCSLLSKELCAKRPYTDIEDGVNAMIFDPKDIASFSKKLNLLVTKPEIAFEIGKNARKFAEKHEFFNKYVSENIKMYEEIV